MEQSSLRADPGLPAIGVFMSRAPRSSVAAVEPVSVADISAWLNRKSAADDHCKFIVDRL
jgi:hypothetical protein